MIVCFDHCSGDIPVLCVGNKEPGGKASILKAFKGDEAIELWEKLTKSKIDI